MGGICERKYNDWLHHLCSMFNVNMGIMSNGHYKGVGEGGEYGKFWKEGTEKRSRMIYRAEGQDPLENFEF